MNREYEIQKIKKEVAKEISYKILTNKDVEIVYNNFFKTLRKVKNGLL